MGILGDIVGGLSGSKSAKKLGRKQRAFVRQGSQILKKGARYNAERMRYAIPRGAEIQRGTINDVYNAQAGGLLGSKNALGAGENAALAQTLQGLDRGYYANRGGIDDYASQIGGGLNRQRGELMTGYKEQLDALKGMTGDSEDYANRGLDMFKGFADQARDFYNPFMQGGQEAQKALMAASGIGDNAGYEQFYKSPGYQFQLDQGNKNIQQSAAAKGGLFSGATGKALDQFGQGIANQSFGDYVNRLQGLQQQGLNAGNNFNQFNQSATQGRAGILGDLSNQQERMGNTQLGILGNRSGDIQRNTMASAGNRANAALGKANLTADYQTDIAKNKALNTQKVAAIGSQYAQGMGQLGANRAGGLGGIDLQKLQQTIANQMNKNQQFTNINYDTNAQLGDISSNVYKAASGADRGFIGGLLGTVGGIAGGALGGLPGAALGASLGGGMVGNPYGQQGGGGGLGGLALQGLGMLGSGIGGLFGGGSPSYGIGSQLYPQGMGMGIGQQALPLSSFQAGYGG